MVTSSVRLVLALVLLTLASTLANAAANPPAGVHALAAVARQAAAPAPSRRMGKTKRNAQKTLKQAHRSDYSLFLCPNKVAACPVPAPGSSLAAVKKTDLKQLADWFKAGFECIDTRTEMGSCGGCVSLGEGFVSLDSPLSTFRVGIASLTGKPKRFLCPLQTRLHDDPARE